jgi:RNA polymerase sigma factor (sigma-70 family)
MTPLLAQIRRGERAFERLYRRHVADVYRYALVVLRDPDDAEDVTQTTFLNAYRAFKRGERPHNVRAWLLALAHSACRQRAGPDGDDDEDEARLVQDQTPPTPSEIRRALGHLPFNQRAALVMRELESRPYAELAHVLGLSPAGVETLVFEARRALREQLEGTLSCHEAERAISRQVDGRLVRSERKRLRRHLRQCAECAGLARSQRARRAAWKVLASVPLPASLQSFFGPGGVMATTIGKGGAGAIALGVVAKALALAAIGAGGVAAVHEGFGDEARPATAPAVAQRAAPTAPPVTPARRPAITPVQARSSQPDRPARRAAERPASPIANGPAREHRRAAATQPAAEVVASHSQVVRVRARPRSKAAAPVQTAANPAAAKPAPPPPPPPPQSESSTKTLAPSPSSTQPPALPQFPPAPPLPLPLPEPPKLP